MGFFNRMMIEYMESDDSYPIDLDILSREETKIRANTSKDISKTPKNITKNCSYYSHYTYSGPVYIFDTKVEEYWIGHTMAKSAKEASRNLAYQYKRDHKWPIRSPIILPNPIVLEE